MLSLGFKMTDDRDKWDWDGRYDWEVEHRMCNIDPDWDQVKSSRSKKWNQPLPTEWDVFGEWCSNCEYRWEEKSAYEARGQITGIQVATDGNLIKRIRFAFNHTFEEWRATGWSEGDTYWGEGGVEQDPFLLEEGDQVVGVTTYEDKGKDPHYDDCFLCGLELLTTSGQRVFWGKESEHCKKRSETKETFLAYCSGGVGYPLVIFRNLPTLHKDFALIFHWEQNKPTQCAD